MDPAPCIEINGVSKWYGDRQVLKDLTLAVPCGGIYGLLGPSGCGKTTTVRIMAGILAASAGEAFLFGQRVPTLDLLSRIGYMAQSDALYGALSGRENLEFFGSLYGMRGPELRQRIVAVMEMLHLGDELDKTVRDYSGGMKRRLSLAAAILHAPPVLLLDEPTVGIDPLLRSGIWSAFRQMADAGTTLLITTHVMDEAEKCNHLAMLRDGVLIAVGTPGELIERSGTSTLEAAFIHYSRDTAGPENEEVRHAY